MGDTRKLTDLEASPWASQCDAALLEAVRASLADVPSGCAVGVGLSAGPDSATLALHAACVAHEQERALHCFHIHHGLCVHADAWQAQAHALASLLGASCHSRRVHVDIAGRGVEAAARAARYAALADLARKAGVRHILLAHHQNDQAETVLLRLLRGAGPLALAAMEPVAFRDGLHYHRPWLTQPRAKILACAEQFSEATGWHPVDDPSNTSTQYARGVVRAELAPVLDAHWPAWRQTLARHARQAAELSAWLKESAQQDWADLEPSADGCEFSLAAWRRLSESHQAPVLRYWLQCQGLRMPSEARLSDWLRQLRGVHALGHDRDVRLPHDGFQIEVHRGRVKLMPGQAHGAHQKKHR
ncbi:MAG TPA: tRNA lysidine(34) synthetase TilS [Castellaniella sp.]|uniref:tRNA lysidine(34) synthetase TilS n=1 Tax=Castellaniella sp. TaxID=1955812 RepID=UPI002F063EB2